MPLLGRSFEVEWLLNSRWVLILVILAFFNLIGTDFTLSSSIKPNNGNATLQLNSTSKVLPEWGGKCTKTHWKKCSELKTFFSYYNDTKAKDPKKWKKHHEINCKNQTFLCLRNGWTVTRCQLLCMGTCNKRMMSHYDEFVKREGQC